jgi:hypothetical protein
MENVQHMCPFNIKFSITPSPLYPTYSVVSSLRTLEKLYPHIKTNAHQIAYVPEERGIALCRVWYSYHLVQVVYTVVFGVSDLKNWV